MIKSLLNKLGVGALARQISNFSILASAYGQFKSIRKNEAILKDGSSIPWYTYPAIEYLNAIDFSGKSVFEFGSGNSSLFWASRAKSIVSVEDNEQWFNKVKESLGKNQKLVLRPSKAEYANVIHEFDEIYDVVVIDGNHRPECARACLEHVHEHGIVVLDNSDWYYKTAKYIRDTTGFIQIDFYGFGPINHYTWTTSIFISRSVNLLPMTNRQPVFSVGGLTHELINNEDY